MKRTKTLNVRDDASPKHGDESFSVVSVIPIRCSVKTIQHQQAALGNHNRFFTIVCPICKERLTLLEGTDTIPAHGTGECAFIP